VNLTIPLNNGFRLSVFDIKAVIKTEISQKSLPYFRSNYVPIIVANDTV